MINPIGTFVTHTDTALVATMNGIIGYETAQMTTPIAVCGVIYYAIQGLRLVNGDPEPLDNFAVLWRKHTRCPADKLAVQKG